MIFMNPEMVPDPPDTGLWVDDLRWLIAVIDDDDDIMPFVASVLSYCCNNNGITERQGKAITKIMDRKRAEHEAGILACQCIDDGPDSVISVSEAVTLQ